MKAILASVACSVALGAALPAAAVTVAPGDQGFPTGTTVAARPELAGTVLADITTPYSITINDLGLTSSGVVQSRVVRETASGTLDFYWRIIPDAGSELDVSSFSVEPWTGLAVETDFRTDGLGDYGPHRFINNAGIVAAYDSNWYFDPPSATAETYFFFARTDARAFALTSEFHVSVTGQAPTGGPIYFQAASGATFAPTAAIPEPATWALMIGGFALAGAEVRRRRRLPEGQSQAGG